ncbi:MAG: UpxY family transcription antiterminator [Chlamydiae bacterium]|nr:UpxY family transcription antiterminator [Chlamydiota bacterium]MBI3266887.1 UpxY family transcription antiterminator [Chlamydiota bacterium]
MAETVAYQSFTRQELDSKEAWDFSLNELRSEEKWVLPQWFILYTRSRHEKFLELQLRRREIETFLPLRKIQREWSDRRVTIEEPLFRGYIFVHIPLYQKERVLNLKGAVRLVGSSSGPIPVEASQMMAVKRFMEEEIVVDPYPYLRVGEMVRVKGGPFKGVEGFIVRKDKRCRLVISFNLIMKSVSIEMDEAWVEPL